MLNVGRNSDNAVIKMDTASAKVQLNVLATSLLSQIESLPSTTTVQHIDRCNMFYKFVYCTTQCSFLQRVIFSSLGLSLSKRSCQDELHIKENMKLIT